MKERRKRNTAIKILAVFWVMLTALGVLSVLWSLPPVSPSKVERLTLGIATNEARAILGKPTAVSTDVDGHEMWEYNRLRLSSQTLMLHFDLSGHLTSYERD